MSGTSASEIKSRIESVSETKKVTDAMYMISSVKMRRAKREYDKTAPYFEALKSEITELLRYIPSTENRYFKARNTGRGEHLRHGILLVTSDKGLAGDYNRTAIGVAAEYMKRHPETVLFVVGEYGRRYCTAAKMPFESEFVFSSELPSVYEARKMCAELLEYYDDGRLDEINIIYTDYKVGKPSECRRDCLLPLSRSNFGTARPPAPIGEREEEEKEFIPSPDVVLDGIVPAYLTGFIYSSLTSCYCSEQEARMTAMSAAGKNAKEMIKELKIKYNSIRQAAITREITEITAGARALSLKRSREAVDDTEGVNRNE